MQVVPAYKFLKLSLFFGGKGVGGREWGVGC
jgi:hypothetical protein